MQILNILKSGAAVNFFAVILAGGIGVLLRRGISERYKNVLLTGMALCVLLIGIDGMLNTGNKILVIIISMAIGGILGELADLDGIVRKCGNRLEKFFSNGNNISEGFVTATLIFCVGAMSIVGSLESGFSGDNTTLYSKSVIDAITAIALSSTLGIGVALSAFPVVILEGSVTLLAKFISPYITDDIIIQMSSIGSILVAVVALNMLGITKIKVMNYVPAIFLPILLCLFI